MTRLTQKAYRLSDYSIWQIEEIKRMTVSARDADSVRYAINKAYNILAFEEARLKALGRGEDVSQYNGLADLRMSVSVEPKTGYQVDMESEHLPGGAMVCRDFADSVDLEKYIIELTGAILNTIQSVSNKMGDGEPPTPPAKEKGQIDGE